jgi:3-hydroxyisobutyrate dehydrogenase-like beta-hydroxyacid dehydrogenase
MHQLNVAVIGLGEAGRRFGGFVAAQASVIGFDVNVPEIELPFPVASTAAECVRGADLVLSFTTATGAISALKSVVSGTKRGAVYVDFSTTSPAAKVSLASVAMMAELDFVDAAIMAPVARAVEQIPILISGPRANFVAEILGGWGMDISGIAGGVGSAAARKLVRSVAVKGLTAAMIESLRAAEAYKLLEWFAPTLDDIARELSPAVLHGYLTGTLIHSRRRVEEMEAAAAMLEDRGEAAPMSRAAVEVLRSIPTKGIPGVG